MDANDKMLIRSLNDILIKIVNGNLDESIVDIEKLDIESNILEIKELTHSIKKLSMNIYEALNFSNMIANGNLNANLDRDNRVIDSLKQLQSTLKHLTWQLNQIAKGDYNQNVSYLGDFSEAFNLMINALREKDEKIRHSNEELNKKNLLLLEANRVLTEKSITDSLTKLYNHQYIYDAVIKETQLSKLHGRSLCLMMADIDFFKRVNDEYGHLIGDKVIIKLTQIIKDIIRETDLAGRYGGEEFLIVLPGTKLNEALSIAEKIKETIENRKFHDKRLKVTISIGVAEYTGEDVALLINKADNLLYKAKENGRNRIEY